MFYDLTKEECILIGDTFGIDLAIGKHSGIVYRLDRLAPKHSENDYEEFHPYWDNSLLFRMFEDMVKGCSDRLTALIQTHKQWDDSFNVTILKTWLTWKKENGISS